MHTLTQPRSWPRVSQKRVRARKRIDRAVAGVMVYRIEPLEARRLLSTTYYVAVNGSDSNAGTDPAHPFATIQAGLNKALTSGDVVQVAGGTYRGQYGTHFMASGNSAAPITLQAAPGQTVIVDGAVLITGWTKVGSSAVYTVSNWNHYFAAQESGTGDARSQPRDQLYVDGQYLPEASSLATMSPGTFYVNPSGTHAIYAWLADGSNPNNHAMEGTATASPLLTNFNGSNSNAFSYIVVNGLQFQHCANIEGTGASEVEIFNGQNATVENVSVQYAAGAGIGLSSTNSLVKDCHFNHNGQEGIASIEANNLLLLDCETAYNNALPGKQFDVIFEAGATKFIESNGVVIDGLVSHDNWGDGLWFDGSNTNATIRNCVLSNNYGYGIHYEISSTATIYNNVIFDNHFHYNYQNGVDGYGIFLSSSIGCVVYNNTIVGNDGVGFVSSGLVRGNFLSYDNQFFNNIVVANGPAVLIGDVSAASATTIPAGTTLSIPYSYSKSDYNLYYNAAADPNTAIAGFYATFSAWQAAGLDTHSQFADPLFVSQSNNQFQLNSGSPALTGGATSWPNVSIHEANPQIRGAHFDTLPTGSDFDNLPVAVTSDTPSITGANSIAYKLTFSEPVKNVTTAAFQLTGTGTAAGTISGVSAGAGTNFTVTVTSVTGVGTLRLDVLPNAIQDAAGVGKTAVPYNGGYPEPVPLVTTPMVTSITPYTAVATASNFLAYLVTFNEAVYGLSASNFQTTATGTVTGSVVPEGGLFSSPVAPTSGTTFEVLVGPTNIPEIVGTHTDVNGYPGPITGRGTLRLDFVDGSGNVKDASGNVAPSYTSGAVATIVDPAVTLTSPTDGSTTTNTRPTFTGAAGTAAGDSSTIEMNIYPNTAASGNPLETFNTTASGGTYTVTTPTALAAGTYTVQARQANTANTTGYSAANVFTVTTGTSTPAGQIDAGGPASGTYVADTDFSGGTAFSAGNVAIDTSAVTNPAPQNVYQTQRYGNFSYVLPGLTAGKQYTVRLDFAETYWSTAGQRLFNVSINGTSVLSGFDIYATAGGKNKAITESFTATADSGGNVTIVFSSVKDNAMVDAVSITPLAPTGPPPTITTPLYNSFNLTDSEADLAVAATGSGTLTYAWSSSPSVTFAQGPSTTAGNNIGELQTAGTYQFTVKITDSDGGGSITQTISVVVPQLEESISLTPVKPTVADKGTQQFTATALDQFGNPLAKQPAFTWTVSGGGVGGSINPNTGLYTAPASGTGTDTVNVSDVNVSGVNTTVTVAAQITGTGGVQLDAGGPASGSYTADADFSGGATYSAGNVAINTSAITNPAPQSVFQTERYGNFAYTIPNLTAGAQYSVTLDFAELYWSTAGQRLFNVSINGSQVLKSFDIYATAGGKDKAIAESFTATANSGGTVTIVFTSVKDNAKVSAIQVAPAVSGGPTADLSITNTDSKTNIAAGSADTYTVVVTNNGPAGVTGATVADAFPAAFTSVTYTATPSGGATGFTASGSGNINDTAVNLPSGSSVTYTVNGTVSPTATGTLANTATVTAPSGVTDPTGNNSATDSDTITGTGGTNAFAIDAGGPASGSFVADTDFSGGTPYSTTAAIDTSQISTAAPQQVYQTERYGNFTYTVAGLTAGASYNVQLDFDELYWTAANQRIFNVSINGTAVLPNFDIYATANGKDKAIARLFTATADTGGKVTIAFTSVKDKAKVDGIEITPI